MKNLGKPHPVRALLLLTQPSVAMLAMMLILMQWRIPTQVQIELIFQKEDFMKGEAEVFRQMMSGNIPLDGLLYAEIRYPDFPKHRPVEFSSCDKIDIIPITDLSVVDVSRDTDHEERRLRLTGSVELFRIVSRKRSHDLRVSQFDTLLHSRWALFGILGLWLAFTVIGWLNLYRQLGVQ